MGIAKVYMSNAIAADEGEVQEVGICEICETMVYSDDAFCTGENGTCWHKACDGEVSCYE